VSCLVVLERDPGDRAGEFLDVGQSSTTGGCIKVGSSARVRKRSWSVRSPAASQMPKLTSSGTTWRFGRWRNPRCIARWL
jgi:hypothetical protein